MGRKRILTKDDILNVTGEVLRNGGIQEVHFKKLAEELQVSRSTLYEYFKNKEELILSYMRAMMDEMNRKIQAVPPELPPNEKLKQLLHIFLEHADTYHIDQMIHELQTSDKQVALFYKTEVHKDLMKTHQLMGSWIEEAKEAGIWTTDVSSTLISDVIFHSILFSNRKKIGAEDMTEQLFQMMEHGLSKRNE
ncbi:TetR/AcrR family transcriptional regulator [Halobacillus kuroshimensis]|uniref:TetR/AcrR family transcriptional regulator n=1 Tax=Halobacillus kuroshimensis TaxID=302481 RepID=A0ABS3DTF8_9BACI|nr:TetR/AcrR family transcriptional regulator [Halobacillus kuroshimensis]MBN8234611.1 TetR/AcrR family transcriptional regulator [Halobacillus kuroshimensis]